MTEVSSGGKSLTEVLTGDKSHNIKVFGKKLLSVIDVALSLVDLSAKEFDLSDLGDGAKWVKVIIQSLKLLI